ncbi:MAG: CHASE2 domain-containing protein [Desulfobulbaceae bacterium]|nr:CHASE2 domain-containing protein [Desulfobulbaceae bacterium]
MTYRRQQSRWQKFVVLYGAVFTVFFAFLFIFQPTFLSLVGLKVYDSMVRSLPQGNGAIKPLIIDIDEKSLDEFGQWPWPRYRIAFLLDKLNSFGAKSVALDVLFAEEDRTSLHVLQRELLRDTGVKLSFDGLVDESRSNNDHILARSLAKGPFVLGYKFLFEENSHSPEASLYPLEVIIRQNGAFSTELPSLYSALDVTANIPELSTAARASGFLNYPGDEDGVIRRVPLLMGYHGKIYPSLALAAAMKVVGTNKIVLETSENKVESLNLQGRRIPVDAKGNLLLSYKGRSHFFEYISAADVLNDSVDKERLAGKIFLVGTSAAGLQDIHPTPLDPVYPGVEVHATIIENILNEDFLSRPLWSRGAELFSILFWGFASTLILAGTRPLTSIVFFFLGSAGAWCGSYLLLAQKGIFLNPLFAILILIINFAVLSLLKYWREEKRLQKRNRELLLAQNTTIVSMTALAETRDNETGSHILRTQHYVRALAEALSSLPKFEKELNWSSIDLLFRSAPLHDIGKVGVPDHILLNPGKLTAEEFEQMKGHTRLGYETLVRAEGLLEDKGEHTFLSFAKDITYCHHEKWDGSGYPRGLQGNDIPIAGRLMALADVYDALITKRRYKRAFSHEEAMEIIVAGRDRHFDPDVVDAFLALEESFRLIAEHFKDEEFGLKPPVDIRFATE